MHLPLPMVALLACGSQAPPETPLESGPEPSTPTGTAPTHPPAPEPHVDEGELSDMDAADPAGWLFDDTVVHTVEIELPPESSRRLIDDPYEWVPGGVTIDGEVVPEVGVRLRGKIGSFRPLTDKPKIGIDFNAFVGGQEFYGLERINLNNSVADCSLLREPLAYRIYREAGVTVPRIAFAEVTVGGEYKGLYHLLEHPDDAWLQTAYPPGTGNLYDGKYVYDGTWAIELIDFTPQQHDDFQLEEGIDIGHADIHAITGALRAWEQGAAAYADVDGLIAFEQLHPYLAAEHYSLNWDGYALNTNNYRVYFDPSDGDRMRMIPTDLDLAFPELLWWSWEHPSGRIVEDCWADGACALDQRAAVEELLLHLETVDLLGQLEAWATLTEALGQQEPYLDCSDPGAQRQYLVDWVRDRPGELRDEWGL